MKKEILEKVMATGSCETLCWHYERRGNEILRIHQHQRGTVAEYHFNDYDQNHGWHTVYNF